MNLGRMLIQKTLHPQWAVIVLLVVLSAGALAFTFATNQDFSAISIISYVLSAYTLSVLFINSFQAASKMQLRFRLQASGSHVRSFVQSNKFYNRYTTDLSYRATVFLCPALIMNLLYAGIKLFAGVYYASFWYGADALFYVALSLTQFLMLRHIQKRKGKSTLTEEYRQYRFCGFMLFTLIIALIGVVYQIVHLNMSYQYPGLLIYAVATYAFIYLGVAIANIIKCRKLNSPILTAIMTLVLAKAFVAIFALQTAMLTSFGDESVLSFQQAANAITGGAVCLLIICMAVIMVARANKNLKKIAVNDLEA